MRGQIRERAFYYFAQLLHALGVRKPVVMLLEDLHWADDSSLDMLDYALRTFPHIPLLTIATSRPMVSGQAHQWVEAGSALTSISLDPLSPDHARALVAEILQRLPAIPQVLTELIVSRAEGNPFFVEELVKMLLDEGIIVHADDEQWRVDVTRLATLTVPPTLTGILQARLDSLLPEERLLAQCASAVGRVFLGGGRSPACCRNRPPRLRCCLNGYAPKRSSIAATNQLSSTPTNTSSSTHCCTMSSMKASFSASAKRIMLLPRSGWPTIAPNVLVNTPV